MKKKSSENVQNIFCLARLPGVKKFFLGPWQIYLYRKKIKKGYVIARFRLKIQFLSKMLIFGKSSPFEPLFDPAKIGVYQKFSFSMFLDPTELELTTKTKILFRFSKLLKYRHFSRLCNCPSWCFFGETLRILNRN